MGDSLVSTVAQRLIAILEEQIRNEVNLVRGVKKEVRNMSTELERVRDLLDDADRRGYQDKNIKNWLRRLEDTSYEMDDVLDEWVISLHKLQIEQQDSSGAPRKLKVFPFIQYSSCLCFKKVATRHDIAVKVKNVKAQLDAIFEEAKKYDFISNQHSINSFHMPGRVKTYVIEVDEVRGRENDRDILVNKLIGNSSNANLGDRLHITSVVGQGGLGKTTLAQLVYNDIRVKDTFPLRIWICVSDPFDEANIAKRIIEEVQECSPSTNQLQRLLELLTKAIFGQKILLVLDDVWNGENSKWGPLKNTLKSSCAAGSKILVTTRNEKVAIEIGTTKNEIHHLGLLSNDDCESLLRHQAFSERSGEISQVFLDISCEIARRCKGLPLAVNTLGSVLRFKNTVEEWRSVLNSEIWQLKSAKVTIFPHLLLSYNELSPTQKRCFSYCAVFPKDHVIVVDQLIQCWMALGYLNSIEGDASELEFRGREYFDNLAMHSLFQDFERDDYNENIIVKCKMHDIIHDFALYLREGNELNCSNSKVEEEAILANSSGCQASSPLLDVSNIKKYRSMVLADERSFDMNACDRLKGLRLLSLRNCGLSGIPKEIEKLIHLRFLDLSLNKFTSEDLKTGICRLYNLQTLLLSVCELLEIPFEIGKLIQLRHLDLSFNNRMKDLPESICELLELRTLNINGCHNCKLPQGVARLINLKHLHNYALHLVKQHPQGLAQLTSLCTLGVIRIGGNDLTKLGCLKNLNNLSRSLRLQIKLGNSKEDDFEDARQSALSEKICLQQVEMDFLHDKKDDREEEEDFFRRRNNVLDALKPNPSLKSLCIMGFKGSKAAEWITSPIYQLRKITLDRCAHLSSLPPLGKLPCLEELVICEFQGLEYVGREFLGITSSSSTIGFPKLKVLTLSHGYKWKEWEDITAEEEEAATISVLPLLITLEVLSCKELSILPHRLLRKAPLIQNLHLGGSDKLVESYTEESSLSKFISHIPNIEVEDWWAGW